MSRADLLGLLLLLVFIVAATAGGSMISGAAGAYSLAGSCLVVAAMLGWSPGGGS